MFKQLILLKKRQIKKLKLVKLAYLTFLLVLAVVASLVISDDLTKLSTIMALCGLSAIGNSLFNVILNARISSLRNFEFAQHARETSDAEAFAHFINGAFRSAGGFSEIPPNDNINWEYEEEGFEDEDDGFEDDDDDDGFEDDDDDDDLNDIIIEDDELPIRYDLTKYRKSLLMKCHPDRTLHLSEEKRKQLAQVCAELNAKPEKLLTKAWLDSLSHSITKLVG